MSKLSDYSKFDHLSLSDDEDDEDDYKKIITSSSSSSKQQHEPIPPTSGTPTMTVSSQLLPPIIQHVRHPTRIVKPSRFMAQLIVTDGNRSCSSSSNDNTIIVIYEWEQTLNEVILYIPSPIQKLQQQQQKQQNQRIVVTISSSHLKVGIEQQNNNSTTTNYYIDEDIYHPIDMSESTWCIEEDEDDDEKEKEGSTTIGTKDVITIYLQKVAKGLVWDMPLCGPSSTTLEKKIIVHPINPIQVQEIRQEILLERWSEENPGMDFRDATFNNSGSDIPDPRTYMGGISYE